MLRKLACSQRGRNDPAPLPAASWLTGEKGAHALLAEVLDAGAQADPGKGEQKGPAGKIAERQQLGFGERAGGGEGGDEQEAKDKLGELLPQKGGLVAGDAGSLAFGGPIERVAEDDDFFNVFASSFF